MSQAQQPDREVVKDDQDTDVEIYDGATDPEALAKNRAGVQDFAVSDEDQEDSDA